MIQVKNNFITGSVVILMFLLGVMLGYGVAFNRFSAAIEGQAIIDIARNLTIVQKIKNTPDFNVVRADIDLNIHRHLLQVDLSDGVSCDKKDNSYKKNTILRLSEYWREYPPFEGLAAELKNSPETINSLRVVRESLSLWGANC